MPCHYTQALFPLAPITVVVGHYGVGKTNFSLNLAFDSARLGKQVSLVDLDVVNPYFRSSDYAKQLSKAHIRLISPTFAGTALDLPSLSGAIYPVLNAADEDHPVIIDAGGDDVGATSLGRFAQDIASCNYAMLYVVNIYRNLTQTPEDAAGILREIEEKTKLKAHGIINNSHLQSETTIATIENSLVFAKTTSELLDLPLLCTTVSEGALLREEGSQCAQGAEPENCALLSMDATQSFYLVQIYVHTLWEQ